MAVFFNEGEAKKRPGVYQRFSNIGLSTLVGARDGICAIPVHASWGPLGEVVKNNTSSDLAANYGTGAYDSTNHTVPAAEEMFNGGAATVYTYRLGTGGTKADKQIVTGLTVTAKYVGTMSISVAVREKLGDDAVKQFLVYSGNTLVEIFDFAATGSGEGASLIAASAGSKYVTVSGTATTVPEVAVASGHLVGGANPTVTNEDYSTAFAALESFFYNVIAIDVDDDEDCTLGLLLQAYLDNAYRMGKLAIAVLGEKSTVSFADRCAHARAFNDEKVVYLGGGWMNGAVSKDGVLSICYTAGVIASIPSNKGITHNAVRGATDLCESLTFSQYEDAIDAGMLMVSMSSDGSIWFDTGINTLVNPDAEKDDGWKKIRRVKTRFELFDRLNRTMEPKVGNVSADSDGVADVVQSGQRVVDAMATERKLMAGGKFIADPANPFTGDSAWFIIQADDIDSLEKIYLHYQFRYSQNV